MSQKANQFPIESLRWLSRQSAAGYLEMSPNQFDRTIRPLVTEIIVTGSPRFDRNEIDRVMERSKAGEQ